LLFDNVEVDRELEEHFANQLAEQERLRMELVLARQMNYAHRIAIQAQHHQPGSYEPSSKEDSMDYSSSDSEAPCTDKTDAADKSED